MAGQITAAAGGRWEGETNAAADPNPAIETIPEERFRGRFTDRKNLLVHRWWLEEGNCLRDAGKLADIEAHHSRLLQCRARRMTGIAQSLPAPRSI